MSTVTDSEPVRTNAMTPGAHVVSWLRDYSVVVVVVVMFVVMSATTANFFSVRNVMNILDSNAPLMLVALGTTFVLIAGAFDLSSGQALSMCGIFCAYFTLHLDSAPLGILLGVLVGVPVGLINGLLVGAIRVNSFLATLATGLVMGGIGLWATGDSSLDLSDNSAFLWLGSHRFFGEVPASVALCAVAFGILWVVLSKTVIGREVFAVGSNPEAARLSGVSIAKVMTFVFVIGGLTAGLGGALVDTRAGVGNSYGPANTLTLNAIAAVVIGGTSITGGRGALWRTVFGVLLLALLQNALNFLNLQPFWQQIVSGAVILMAIILNTLGSRTST
jgi:ribose transport system permease protein